MKPPTQEDTMKILIIEDDFASRKILASILSSYGKCDLAVDGIEGLKAVSQAYRNNEPYDFICLDIMMPKLDGQETLKIIREMEKERNIEMIGDQVEEKKDYDDIPFKNTMKKKSVRIKLNEMDDYDFEEY